MPHLHVSTGLREALPEVTPLLRMTESVALRLDPGIGILGLRVEVKRHCRSDHYSGWAFPEESTYRHSRWVRHPDGRVVLNIGPRCCEEDVIRVYAHELRHIAQFQRGRIRYGFLTTYPLDEQASEEDAEYFEEEVLERI